ncbi:hypothetical protein G9A89_009576 [Geosiphon pyriformis]|nr:hypothetical protein G9A89_009576 [Geosiphon pyriformis]
MDDELTPPIYAENDLEDGTGNIELDLNPTVETETQAEAESNMIENELSLQAGKEGEDDYGSAPEVVNSEFDEQLDFQQEPEEIQEEMQDVIEESRPESPYRFHSPIQDGYNSSTTPQPHSTPAAASRVNLSPSSFSPINIYDAKLSDSSNSPDQHLSPPSQPVTPRINGDNRFQSSSYSPIGPEQNGGYPSSGSPSPYAPSTPRPDIEPFPLEHHEYPDHPFAGCSSITDYTILNKLGEGTFGEVHKGMHNVTGNVVALKRIIMHNEKEGIPITAIREIKILRQLNHANVISLNDLAIRYSESTDAEVSPSIYMVFPYMDHDLAGLLENPNVQFSEAQIKCYLKQLLEGTFYLHQNRILHRDMKAANLLINNQGILKIADFGLSRPMQDKSLTGCVVTRWYRPPELLLGEKRYTTAIDMWAVGCVFAEMLKGKPILPGRSDFDQLEIIFQLCGSPTEESWPNWKELPLSKDVKAPGNYQRVVRSEYDSYGTKAAKLLDQLLVLNPSNRLTAFSALDDDYFWTDPLPSDPKDLPAYEDSHEYDLRKYKKIAQQEDGRRSSRVESGTENSRPRRERNTQKRNRSRDRDRVRNGDRNGSRKNNRQRHTLPERPSAGPSTETNPPR